MVIIFIGIGSKRGRESMCVCVCRCMHVCVCAIIGSSDTQQQSSSRFDAKQNALVSNILCTCGVRERESERDKQCVYACVRVCSLRVAMLVAAEQKSKQTIYVVSNFYFVQVYSIAR